ncbi:MAG: MXAN_5187 C-terminal domain-containing protein [Myxococcota bacterium]
MMRLLLVLGFALLFGLGYGALERISIQDASVHAERAARAQAELSAAETEVEWLKLVDETRGVARAAAVELGRRAVDADLDPEALRPILMQILDRAGGRGSVALFAPDRRKILGVAAAGGQDLDPSLRSVEDARSGGPLAHLEFLGNKPSLIAAAPVLGKGDALRSIIAIGVPIDRRTLSVWAGEGGDSWTALVSTAGDVVATNFEGGITGRIPKNTEVVDVRDDSYAVHQRLVYDDGGAVGAAAGFAKRNEKGAAELARRVRLVYGVIAALALVLAIAMMSLAGNAPSEVEATTTGDLPDRDPTLPRVPKLKSDPSPAASADMGDNLLAAARMLDAGNRPLLPAVRHSESIVQGSLPPPRYSAPPAAVTEPSAVVPTASVDARPSLNDRARTPVNSGPPGPAGGPTYRRGMSPAPPAGGVPSFTPQAPYTPTGTFDGYTPLPMLDEASRTPVPAGMLDHPPRPIGKPPVDGTKPFDEAHYRVAFEEFVGNKKRLGEVVDNISFDGFSAKLRKIEQTLIEKHGCRSVRFQVIVRDKQVSLRPQLVR